MVADLRRAGRDEPRERLDQRARLVEVDLVGGVRVVGEAELDRGGGHEVHRDGLDHLDGRNLRDVAGIFFDEAVLSHGGVLVGGE